MPGIEKGPSAECRRFLVSLSNACGAAVRGRKYDFHPLHIPGSTHVFRLLMLPRFKRNTRALHKELPAFSRSRHFRYSVSFFMCLFRLVSSVSVLVSVCYIDLLSVLVFLTYIVFVFREQKMVQRIQEIVAKYEDRLREMQSDIVPYNTDHRVIG